MSDWIIKAENLGKKYRLQHQAQGQRYVALRDVIAEKAKSVFQKLKLGKQKTETSPAEGKNPFLLSKSLLSTLPATEDFWALKDVSFEIKRGEVVGIIGCNGAGKSTLLKILSRITEPTEGQVTLRGRVASLLEVGTGFHPELTGRENIFLNGAILGMTTAEIRRKFDEIVAFAEVEKFLDTPVKRYSSGMYVRLAFAVAAHLEPEILIVDEVLAVGDAQFQKKCLGKMQEFSTAGRTVLFVSHNMVAVKQLCRKGIWLSCGKVRQIGPVADIAQAYARNVHEQARAGDFSAKQAKGDGQVELISYRITNAAGETSPAPATREDVLIHIKLKGMARIEQPACGLSIYNEFGVLMSCLNTVEQGTTLPPLPEGEFVITIRVSRITFLPGTYTVSFWVMSPQGHIYVMTENSILFEIGQALLYGTCHVDHRWGCVYSDIQFFSVFLPVPTKN